MAQKIKVDDLCVWKTFMAVATFGTMNRASAETGVDISIISRRINSLEEALGVPLFVRHSRYCELTQEGEKVVKEIAPLILKFSSVVQGFLDGDEMVQGPIRISLPDCLTDVMIKWLAEFQDEHPSIMVEAFTSSVDSISSLMSGEYDLLVGVRQQDATLGKVIDLGAMSTYVCATPEYIEKFGEVKELKDFANHRVLINSAWMCPSLIYDPITKGAFSHETGRRFRVDSMLALKSAVMQSIGVAIGLPHCLCEEEFKTGKLVRLMYPMEALSLHFYVTLLAKDEYPPRIMLLLNWLQERWNRDFEGQNQPFGRCCSLGRNHIHEL